jgi:hypothetical protein
MEAKKPMKRKGIQRVCKSKCTLQEGTKNARKSSGVGRWGCGNGASFKDQVAETSTEGVTYWSMTNFLVFICFSLITNTLSQDAQSTEIYVFVILLWLLEATFLV